MDRKMNEKSLRPMPEALADEELNTVSGASGFPFPWPSLSVIASPVTISQANVNTTSQAALGNLGPTTQSAVSVGTNSASVSYGG